MHSHEGQLWFPGLWTAQLGWVWRSEVHQGWVKLEVTPGSRQHRDFGMVIWSKIRVRCTEKKVWKFCVYGYVGALNSLIAVITTMVIAEDLQFRSCLNFSCCILMCKTSGIPTSPKILFFDNITRKLVPPQTAQGYFPLFCLKTLWIWKIAQLLG